MNFYGRKDELALLHTTQIRAKQSSQFTVVIGRRRVGKTRLVLHSLDQADHLYFFVSKKAEKLLCQDFLRQVETTYHEVPDGEINRFAGVFQFVCRLARNRPINLFIDEFQELAGVNSSIFSEIQRDWDLNKDRMRLNLIVCGSVQSM